MPFETIEQLAKEEGGEIAVTIPDGQWTICPVLVIKDGHGQIIHQETVNSILRRNWPGATMEICPIEFAPPIERSMDESNVNGKCPACGQRTLTLKNDGNLQCNNAECSEPLIVNELLEIPIDHIVLFTENNQFVLEHPVACRLGGRSLMDCPVDHALSRLTTRVRPVGKRYPVHLFGNFLAFGDEA